MGIAADVKQSVRDDLYREPHGGRVFWVMVGIGILAIVYGVAGLIVEGVDGAIHFIFLGIAFGTMGAAELVPQDRIELARNLRIGTWISFTLYAAWILVPPFVAANFEMKLLSLIVVAIIGVSLLLLYKVLSN